MSLRQGWMTDSTMVSTAGIRIVKAFDNLLKCGICYEYFTTTVITPCSHNYCSICIRQSLSYRNQCPSCYEETNDSQLRPNRIVDQFLAVYFSIKDKISSNYYDLSSSSDGVSIKSNIETCSSDITFGDGASTSKGITPSLETIPQTAKAENTPSTPKKELRIPAMFSPKKNLAVKTNDVKVSCPVCSVEIPEKNINVHLDVCLQRMNAKKCQPEKEKEKRKHLPKLVYHLLADKYLRKKLSDIGLSTIGDRKVLINRHKKYTLLYNAECDSLNPRPVSEIIKQVKKEEEEEKKVSTQLGKMLKLNVDRKANEKANERAQQQYLQEYKSHFEKLVEAARRNMKSKKDMDKSGTVDKTPDIITLSENSPDHSEVENEINRSSHKRKIIVSDSDSGEPGRDICEVSAQVIRASVHPHIPPKSSNSKLQVSKSGGLHGELRIHQPTKRMLMKSDSECDEPVEDIHDTITQKFDADPPNTTCDKLDVSLDASEKPSDIGSDSAEKAMSNINNSIEAGQHLLDIYNESTEELSSSDDEYPRNKIFQQMCLKNQRLKQNALSPERTKTSASSVSPVLTSKSKNNHTPKSKITPVRSRRGDLTTRLQLKTTSMPSSSKEKSPAGQESEDEACSSDSSSTHSSSLLIYTGPDCESQFGQGTPTKSTSLSPLKSPSSVPESRDGNFDLGIEDILKDSEEFEPLPVRRQSKRILNASRNSPNLSKNVVRRMQIDDL